MSNTKIASISVKRGDKTYSLLTVWSGKYPGTYSIALDKGSEKYPAIGFLDALKAFAAREAFVNLRIDSQTEKPAESRSGGNYDRAAPSGFGGGGGEFGDDSIPF